jgi:SAM-dependent methyltransferase
MTLAGPTKNVKTYDFVSETGRDLFFAAHEREISLLQDSNGVIRSEFAEPVLSCPVCGKKEFNLLFKKQGFAFKQCMNVEKCDHVYADPQINQDALLKAYKGEGASGKNDDVSASDLWLEVLLSDTNMRYDRVKYQRGLKAIDESIRTKKEGQRSILDIGCSVGHFLDIAGKNGWKTLGLELNEKAVSHARNVLGLEVRSQVLEDAGFHAESFDCVTLWGVIEHLKRPIEVLKEIFKILKPGGVLLTFCPNAASLVCRVLREKAATFDGHDHPSNFTPKSIKYAMELAGMKNVSITFHQPDLDSIINYMEGRDPYLKKDGSPGRLFEFFGGRMREVADEFILEYELGYKMMTINRKP